MIFNKDILVGMYKLLLHLQLLRINIICLGHEKYGCIKANK